MVGVDIGKAQKIGTLRLLDAFCGIEDGIMDKKLFIALPDACCTYVDLIHLSLPPNRFLELICFLNRINRRAVEWNPE